MTRVLDFWWDGHPVGQLTQDKHAELGFAYARAWLDDATAQPLSALLSKWAEPFSRCECRPFFGSLLPEEGQCDAAVQALGVSRALDFALLDRLGDDVAGALQLLPRGAPPTALSLDQQPTPLDDAGLIRVPDTLPVRLLLAGEEGLRLSLAGAQSKVPVEGAVALPAPGQPTTHILKPLISRFTAMTENEAFIMRLAAAIGLDVARMEARIVQDRTFWPVQRYDRVIGHGGRVRRIHQEDFCRALGVPPECAVRTRDDSMSTASRSLSHGPWGASLPAAWLPCAFGKRPPLSATSLTHRVSLPPTLPLNLQRPIWTPDNRVGVTSSFNRTAISLQV